MCYFSGAKENDKVYGLVYGAGEIIQVFEDDSFYKIMVHFKNGREVPYTIDGISKWGSFYQQTLFYKKDIDLTDYDFTPVKKVLSFEKIIKLREKNKLQVRCPSGIWVGYFDCDLNYVEKLLEKGKLHLFRKKPEKED